MHLNFQSYEAVQTEVISKMERYRGSIYSSLIGCLLTHEIIRLESMKTIVQMMISWKYICESLYWTFNEKYSLRELYI